jgi:hypothetical protein
VPSSLSLSPLSLLGHFLVSPRLLSLSLSLSLFSQVTVAASFAAHQAFIGLVFQTLPPRHYRAAAHAVKAATMGRVVCSFE